MNHEKAYSSSTDNFRVPLHVALLISISSIFTIDGRWSMRANIQLNSISARVSSQEKWGWNGDTGVCNVGLLSDSDKTVCVWGPKCLRWVLTALLLTAISTTIHNPLNSSLQCEGFLSGHTHIGSDLPFLINEESSSYAPQRPINGL